MRVWLTVFVRAVAKLGVHQHGDVQRVDRPITHCHTIAWRRAAVKRGRILLPLCELRKGPSAVGWRRAPIVEGGAVECTER